MGKTRDKKATYSLPEDLLHEVRLVVKAGAAPSYSAFVEDALREAVARARDEQLVREFRRAARDPLFLADNDEVEKDFESTDAETARTIP